VGDEHRLGLPRPRRNGFIALIRHANVSRKFDLFEPGISDRPSPRYLARPTTNDFIYSRVY